MKNGNRPNDIRNKTLKFWNYFGKDGFLQDDLIRLQLWAASITIFQSKLELLPERKMLKDLQLFNELINVCYEIMGKIKK
jgi:hypothetical protein